MKTAELYSASTAMNMSILSEYVEKRKNARYAQHQIMMIVHVVFKTCSQDINVSTATKITHYELQNATKEKNM